MQPVRMYHDERGHLEDVIVENTITDLRVEWISEGRIRISCRQPGKPDLTFWLRSDAAIVGRYEPISHKTGCAGT